MLSGGVPEGFLSVFVFPPPRPACLCMGIDGTQRAGYHLYTLSCTGLAAQIGLVWTAYRSPFHSVPSGAVRGWDIASL